MLHSQPILQSEPGAITTERGGSPLLMVTAAGTSPLSYQWFKGGVPVSGATNPLLPFFRIGPAEAGAYRVVVSNAAGSVTSRVAQVTVNSAGVVFLVTTPSDSGAGSLRRAIEQANAQPG
ncbi:MAG TPA: immunoglobulin domain-containing protein, partial [Myxococcota bacterium]|nr:immunoglobulin domain-containing protein [Myxococcota bacterium]